MAVATEDEIRLKFESLTGVMDERFRRLWAGAEALAIGAGGIMAVARATGLSRTTVSAGRAELVGGAEAEEVVDVRRRGGGRKRIEEVYPEIIVALESLVDPVTRGDPESPLRWTSKSTRKLSIELGEQGYALSPQKVGQLLQDIGYSLQATRKTTEGAQHPDRNEQFEYINKRVDSHQARGAPVISVDSKKKELVGDFKNGGREWQPKGKPTAVRVHDFLDRDLGKAIPYGVYDIGKDLGWVNVGVDHDTPAFAVESIWQWWWRMGRRAYPDVDELLITADGGGSNSSRARAWKTELQKLADRTQLVIGVSHFPPGTSKWNKIEHRLFSHITENWRGRPLVDHETIVQLIGNTRTTKGLRVKSRLDIREYPSGVRINEDEMSQLNIVRDPFHGEWNYTIFPRSKE